MNKLQIEMSKIMGISKMDRQERDFFNKRLDNYFKRIEADHMTKNVPVNNTFMPVYCENEVIDYTNVESYLELLEKRTV